MKNSHTYWFAPLEYTNEEPELFYFRKEIIKQKNQQQRKEIYPVQISADSRYKLYVNGIFAEAGPAKGNHLIWYYDKIDLAPYLTQEINVVAVEVLHYPTEHWRGNCGIFRTEMPGLYFREIGLDESSMGGTLAGESRWLCRKVRGFQIEAENPYFSPLMIYENRSGQSEDIDWKRMYTAIGECGDEAGWKKAREYRKEQLPEILWSENLKPRQIPFQKRTGRSFLQNVFPLTIAANDTYEMDLDAGELTTGFLKLTLAGGKGAEVEILQSECYAGSVKEHENPFKSMPVKGNRTDNSLNLYGYTDTYEAAGNGTENMPEIYEPFWFRTFRYIRVTVKTRQEPLVIRNFNYEEAGYPLEVKSHVETSDETMPAIWDICERSLRRCMHETYEDCPFYEQLQYAMDARSQMLYTYAVAADDGLARNCMEDFRYSAQYIRQMAEEYQNCPDSDVKRKEELKRFAGREGLINSCYPNYEMNIIPGFSIFYIGMLYDHMMYFGDKEFLQKHMEAVSGILNFFQRNLDERGLVGKIGDINQAGNDWSFIDWAPEWDDTDGVPPCTKQGPITMESLLYLMGLQYASALSEYLKEENSSIGYQKLAQEYQNKAEAYRIRAEKLKAAINQYCVGENGMYQDGPGIDSYSQHCQVFAILTNTVSIETGRELLQKTLENKEVYSQCTIAMMFYLFRALEKCEMYSYTDELWNIWRTMVKNHMTTCAEDPCRSRSDCHAWGALALYELPAAVLGVHPTKPGFAEYELKPQPGKLKWAKGSVATPKGMVHVSWKIDKDGKLIVEEV